MQFGAAKKNLPDITRPAGKHTTITTKPLQPGSANPAKFASQNNHDCVRSLRQPVASRPSDPIASKAIEEGSGVATKVGEKIPVLSPGVPWLKSMLPT